MDWGLILSFAYSLVPIIGVTAYGPQIIALLKHTDKLENFPFATWAIWLFTASVSLAYGAFKLQDVLFSITALSNMIPIIIVMIIAAYKSGLVCMHKKQSILTPNFAALVINGGPKYHIYQS